MRRLIIFSLLLLLLLAKSVFCGEPKAIFQTLNHDFGQVQEGTALTHTFVVKNAGDAPLLIKVKPG